MAEGKHTAGPWEYFKRDTSPPDQSQFDIMPVAARGCGWVTLPQDDPAGVGEYMQVGGPCTEPTIRLMAAAPDLLAALQSAIWRLREVSKNTYHDAEYEDLEAVIARATGQGGAE